LVIGTSIWAPRRAWLFGPCSGYHLGTARVTIWALLGRRALLSYLEGGYIDSRAMFYYGALTIVFCMYGIDQKVRGVDWAFGNSLQLEGFRIHASPLAVVLHFRIPVNQCPVVLDPNIQGFFNDFDIFFCLL